MNIPELCFPALYIKKACNMVDNEIIEWLLNGDISIQYQVYRDIL